MKHVAIFGAPRSGTSWLGQLLNSSPHVAYRYQPLFSFAYKNRLGKNSGREEIAGFYKDILSSQDDFVLQSTNISGKEKLSFQKKNITHLVWKEVRYHYLIEMLLENSDTKVISILRHPCAVLWSWINAPKEFKPQWNILEEWERAPGKNAGGEEAYYGYTKWKEIAFNSLKYVKQYPHQFCLVTYEELNSDTKKVLQRLFEFSGLAWSNQNDFFINASKSKDDNDPYGVFKKEKSNEEWKGKLPAQIEQAVLSDADFHVLNRYYQWNT